MAENKTVEAVEVKKENKFVSWFKRHHEAIITGVIVAGAAGTLGYAVCAAVHHEPNTTVEAIDDTLENLLTTENSEQAVGFAETCMAVSDAREAAANNAEAV